MGLCLTLRTTLYLLPLRNVVNKFFKDKFLQTKVLIKVIFCNNTLSELRMYIYTLGNSNSIMVKYVRGIAVNKIKPIWVRIILLKRFSRLFRALKSIVFLLYSKGYGDNGVSVIRGKVPLSDSEPFKLVLHKPNGSQTTDSIHRNSFKQVKENILKCFWKSLTASLSVTICCQHCLTEFP